MAAVLCRRTVGRRRLRGLGWQVRTRAAVPLTVPEFEHGTVSIVGAPFAFGQPIPGTDYGPFQLRGAQLLNKLDRLGWTVEDRGDLELAAPNASDPSLDPAHGNAKNSFVVGKSMESLHHKVAASYGENSYGDFTLTLGGDHSIAIGSVAGILSKAPRTGVLWVDAHADINTPATSPSGNIHGMPLGFLLEGLLDHAKIPGFEWMVDVPRMLPDQLVFIGLRDVDPGEIKLIKQLGITAYTMSDIDRHGIGAVMDRAMLQLKNRPLHLSYDIDALDPALAPATGTRVPGGLSFREAHYVAETAYNTGRLRSMDMVEVNPTLSDTAGVDATVAMAVEITQSAMGKTIL